MPAATGARSLSDLPDDVLRRILLLAPPKDAASTSVLSRRWRSLWRTSGAVYLDSRFFDPAPVSSSQDEPEDVVGEVFLGVDNWGWEHYSWYPCYHDNRRFSLDFFHGAEKALAAAAAAATVPIRRLTFVLSEDNNTRNLHEVDLVGAVVSNPAARRVEELDIEVKGWFAPSLSLGSLPSEALRLLRITKCSLQAAPPGSVFLRLSELHLHHCPVALSNLQGIVDAAPQLATLHLESSSISMDEESSPMGQGLYQLTCPVVTALVFADCSFGTDIVRIELDAPRLQYLRCKGSVQESGSKLSLKPQKPPNMVQVDLHLVDDFNSMVRVIRVPFWQSIQNFSTAKVLKLKLEFSMDHIALEDDEIQDDGPMRGTLLCNLERLELEAQYRPGSKASMAILATLLRCCPVVRDIWLKLSTDWKHPFLSIDKEARADFDKSVDRFRCRRRKSPRSSLGGEVDGAFGIPLLSEQSFSFLQSHLRKVSLQFCMDTPNCLGVQLAKFFAEKAKVLEEMCIDDGSHKMHEHMNANFRRWIADSAKTRGLAGDAVLAHWNICNKMYQLTS